MKPAHHSWIFRETVQGFFEPLALLVYVLKLPFRVNLQSEPDWADYAVDELRLFVSKRGRSIQEQMVCLFELAVHHAIRDGEIGVSEQVAAIRARKEWTALRNMMVRHPYEARRIFMGLRFVLVKFHIEPTVGVAVLDVLRTEVEVARQMRDAQLTVGAKAFAKVVAIIRYIF